jgi:hypothetical protein
MVHVVRPPPQIVHGDVDDARFDRPARQGLSERIEVVGEDRDDVYAHG